MEKRLLLAVVLMTAAVLITNSIFPPPAADPSAAAVGDTIAGETVVPPAGAVSGLRLPPLPTQSTPGDSVVVQSELYRYVFSTRGAALIRAELPGYPSYSIEGEAVQLVPEGVTDFLTYRLVTGVDTFALADVPYAASTQTLTVPAGSGGAALDFSFAPTEGPAIVLRYTFDPEEYLFSVQGRVEGLGGQPATILTEVGPGLGIHEHPDHHSERELALVTGFDGRAHRRPFRQIESREVVSTPLTWTGIKDKYFLAAVIGGTDLPLMGAVVDPLPPAVRLVGEEEEVEIPRAKVSVAIPVAADGSFAFDAYLGPQDYGRLSQIGYGLEGVTPYGYRWLQPIIRPLAAAVLWVLNTLHDTLGVAYGWVLVLFGVMMRIVLWPLNAKAMRSQMKTMAVQPLLQEIREKYKDDPQKQQEAMLTLYKEHGFNPFGGCLPLLVPFPVLITLFFVFQNTIAFRGAEFLWLPDLSLRDPLYLLPIILVVSMFALQWVMAHLSGMEQNPQMKMMMYFMPLMMGFIFFMLPSGLNLYYAVTQLASIPQQVLISRERKRTQEELKRTGGPKLTLPGGKPKSKAKR
jgi:YidC/Oxa1 family membrane protein insertase